MNNFYRQWIGLGLLTLMLVKAWVIPLICVDYEIRKEYIIKNFCVNKNRPQLNCNGKCYLAKRLAESKKQEERQAEHDYMSSLLYQVMYSGATIELSAPAQPTEISEKPVYPFNSPFLARHVADEIFHPPLPV